MYVRVVRFTGVTQERIDQLRSALSEADGPPPGVNSSALKVMVDSDQGTAIVLQEFATQEDMQEGARVLEAMDPSETPGSRASVDACRVVVELSA